MRLWLDEMVPAAVARELRRLGHDVHAAQEADRPWAHGLEDAEQLDAAVRQGRALVTYNLRDFVPLSQQWAEARRVHMGIVLIQSRTLSPDDMGGLVRALAALLEANPGDEALRDRVILVELLRDLTSRAPPRSREPKPEQRSAGRTKQSVMAWPPCR